jgi:hypothetical protein
LFEKNFFVAHCCNAAYGHASASSITAIAPNSIAAAAANSIAAAAASGIAAVHAVRINLLFILVFIHAHFACAVA